MSKTAKVILSILIIVVGVAVMLTIAGVFIVRQIHVKESGGGDRKSVSVETPFGNVKIAPRKDLDPSSIGIPVYPGASRSDDRRGGAEFQLDSGDFHKDFAVAGAIYYTDDSMEKVRQYYDEKFPGWSHKSMDGGAWHIETHEGSRIRSVSVDDEKGRTRIAIASMGPPASN